MRRITWAGLASAGFHLGRTPYRRGAAFPLHDHDFAEIFWIAAGPGRCRHLTATGEQLLSAGDLVVVRPGDVHGFAAVGEGFTQVNVAFPADSLEHIAARYGIDLGAGGLRPRRLPPGGLERLERAVTALAAGRRDLLARERFLLELADILAPAHADALPADCPPWLAALVARLGAGELLDAGVSGLARAAGCSRGHLARVCAAQLGCSATALINRHRVERARLRLAIGDEPITAIAAGCGLPNLGHFYRVFRAATGCTPRAWRLRARQAG